MADDAKPGVPLNEWQTEEEHIPTITMDEQGKPQVTDRVVKQRYMHVPLIPHQICKSDEHYYQLVEGGRRQGGLVLVKCRSCSVGRQFVPGVHKLEDGKLVPFH